MNTITDYNDLNIHPIQQTRLYVQGRPLVHYNRLKQRNISHELPHWISLIDQEITGDFIAIDCGGWYFANSQRNCTAIEIIPISSKLWNNIHYEYDYLTWHPTYLEDQTVLAYYSSYFKYATIDDLLTFVKIWSDAHSKLIIGIDPSKVKFNYLKYSLVDVVKSVLPNKTLRIVDQGVVDLLFVIE